MGYRMIVLNHSGTPDNDFRQTLQSIADSNGLHVFWSIYYSPVCERYVAQCHFESREVDPTLLKKALQSVGIPDLNITVI